MLVAIVAFVSLFGLVLLHIPIGIAMAIVGFAGLGLILNFHASMASASLVIYETGFSYSLSVIPLFILMGNLVNRARMSDELFEAANAFVGHRRGGLAYSTILACGLLSATSGSSLATTATMAKVAMPQMRAFNYSDRLAAGSITAGGTLGILIPPSIVMVIYGILAETSVGALFAAGLLPGLLAIVLYFLTVQLVVLIDPALAPAGERQPWRKRLETIRGVGPFAVGLLAIVVLAYFGFVSARMAGTLAAMGTVLLSVFYRGVMSVIALFILVIGSIYSGVATPTEAASIGVGVALIFAALRGRLSLRVLLLVCIDSVRTTAMLFVVLIGAMIFANFINFTSLPADLLAFVEAMNVNPLSVFFAIAFIYVALGSVFEEMSMMVLTVPIFLPLVVSLGGDPVWFGIIVVVVTGIGMISPPVGMSMFVYKSVAPDVPLGTIFKGVIPFFLVDIVRLLILILFPAISLFLPHLLRL